MAIFTLSLAVTSCQKEEVEPQVQTDQSVEKRCCGENGTLPPDGEGG